jgi:diguanylate cyclase (GGDEF)-like protein
MPMLERDPLTGLLHRHHCLEDFQILSSGQASFGIALLDIDTFILFNDEYGHREGDEKLKQVAKLIDRAAPPNAKVFRFGGEEFVVLFHGYSMSEVVGFARQVKEAANQAFSTVPKQKSSYGFPDRSQLKLESVPSVSCGIAFYPEHGKSLESLIEAAGRAMWVAGKRLCSGGVLVVAEFDDSL